MLRIAAVGYGDHFWEQHCKDKRAELASVSLVRSFCVGFVFFFGAGGETNILHYRGMILLLQVFI